MLSQELQTVTIARYKPPYSLVDTYELLRDSYALELAKRGQKLNSTDRDTLDKISRATNWLTGDHKCGLMLYGTVGSGKTTLANAMCNLINNAEYSHVSTERKCVTKINASEIPEMVINPEKSTRNYRRVKESEMLFIDDFGTEANVVKSWGNEFMPLIDILQYRYENQLFTIITTNLDKAAIRDVYGNRIADRFNEMFNRMGYENLSYRK